MKYLLDADVFITAQNTYYPFDVVPGFWECIEIYTQKGILDCIDMVKVELTRGNDKLADWVDKHFRNAFLPTNTSGTTVSYTEIINWVEGHSQFKQSAKSDFAAGADGC